MSQDAYTMCSVSAEISSPEWLVRTALCPAWERAGVKGTRKLKYASALIPAFSQGEKEQTFPGNQPSRGPSGCARFAWLLHTLPGRRFVAVCRLDQLGITEFLHHRFGILRSDGVTLSQKGGQH